jgi:hypothetical protein
VLVTDPSYQWIFWSGAAIAAATAVAAELVIPESPQRTPGRIDITGTVLLAAGIAMLRMMGGSPDSHEHDHVDAQASD